MLAEVAGAERARTFWTRVIALSSSASDPSPLAGGRASSVVLAALASLADCDLDEALTLFAVCFSDIVIENERTLVYLCVRNDEIVTIPSYQRYCGSISTIMITIRKL